MRLFVCAAARCCQYNYWPDHVNSRNKYLQLNQSSLIIQTIVKFNGQLTSIIDSLYLNLKLGNLQFYDLCITQLEIQIQCIEIIKIPLSSNRLLLSFSHFLPACCSKCSFANIIFCQFFYFFLILIDFAINDNVIVHFFTNV